MPAAARRRWAPRLVAFIAAVVLPAVGLAQDEPATEWTAEQLNFFESKIRPVLVDKCYSCHSGEAGIIEAELRVDSREGLLIGGSSGAAVVPGDPDASLLLMAIRHDDPDLAMPPDDAGGKLDDSVIADFEHWIEIGMPDPRRGEAIDPEFGAGDEARQWWAFQPLSRPEVPAPGDSSWPASDIDRFVLARLEAAGLRPVDDAEPLALLRRLYFDLIGLPPSPEEAQQFFADWQAAPDRAAQDALYTRVVDRLLASPQFGERWGRHWLDVARYAESSGKDVNILYPYAWRYRDYVIQSFNEDRPYDEFVREQIAGDLLPADSDEQRARQLVATGYLAIGPKSLNEMRGRQFAVDVADEQVDAFSQGILGVTLACARCHDHKFDPVTQQEYTALAGIFLSTETRYGTAGGVGGRNAGQLVELPTGVLPDTVEPMTAEEYERKHKQLADLQQQLRDARADRMRNRRRGNSEDNRDNLELLRATTQASQLEAELQQYEPDGSVKSVAMGVVDKPQTVSRTRQRATRRRASSGFETIGDSPLFVRGDVERPGERVDRALPSLLAHLDTQPIPTDASGRAELAEWLTDPENPLTGRVVVNRVWYWLFGAGIVTSLDNFGTTGALPSHPELLDHLTHRFIDDGWSIKGLVREIVLSRTYRLAATYEADNFGVDPANALLWRHSPRRLDAESIRDAMLAAAGELDLDPPVATVIGRSGDGLLGGPRRAALSEEEVAEDRTNVRSVYLPIARNVEPEVLSVFDFPDSSIVQGARNATNVPSQTLFMLNSDFAAQQAAALARRVLGSSEPAPPLSRARPRSRLRDSAPAAAPPISGQKFEALYEEMSWIVLTRPPTEKEISAARRLLAAHRDDPMEGWTSVARAMLASAEFRSID